MVRVLVFLLLVLAKSLPAQNPAPLTADAIVDRYIAARGGIESIRSVRTLVLRGPPRPDGRPGRFMARARPYYFLVGEPLPGRSYAEGYDGAAWEFYADPGLVLRTTGEPAAASRHTAYFDDPLVSSLEPGWKIELIGTDRVGDRLAYQLRVTYPDEFQTDVLVDAETWLIVAYRKAAPIHAFGEAVETETRVSGWRELNGALFPMRFEEHVIATGEPLSDLSGGWATAEVNVPLPVDYFSPPPEPKTLLARMLNAVYLARWIPQEALAWYRDFRASPATAGIDSEAGVEALGYQCLKNGAVDTAILLLEANLAEHPGSATAHFGLGRAYEAAGRVAEAVDRYEAALAIDPTHTRAAEALARSADS
jgi:hypothetical protein